MTFDLHLPAGWGESGVLVAIPARDEERRLPFALAALAGDGRIRDVMVIANGCTDRTAAIARAGRPGLRVALIETGTLEGGVGEARRIGLAAALDAAPSATVVATTDADCRVAPGWGATTLAALETAHAVCGRVVPDPVEFARLPTIVRRHGNLEDRASDLRAELEGLRRPMAHDPLPRHGQTPGASLAVRADTYLHAGGFDAIRCHEDRRLVARIEAAGGRIARPHDLQVIASCRLTGRAPGGMADTIAARTADAPFLRADTIRLRREIAGLIREIATLRRAPHYVPKSANKGVQNVLSLG